MPSDKVRETTIRFFDDLAERKCPFCRTHIDTASQVGKCVYFDPCGHRLGSGSAADLMKVWAEEGP